MRRKDRAELWARLGNLEEQMRKVEINKSVDTPVQQAMNKRVVDLEDHLANLAITVGKLNEKNNTLENMLAALKKKHSQRIDALYSKYNVLREDIDILREGVEVLEAAPKKDDLIPNEPPDMSVVVDRDGWAYQRQGHNWWGAGDETTYGLTWAQLIDKHGPLVPYTRAFSDANV